MQQKDLKCSELVRKLEDAYELNKHVIIMCENEDYSSTTETDELVVEENKESIVFDNMEGLNFTVRKRNISRISLSNILDSEEIKIDFEKSKITLLICE